MRRCSRPILSIFAVAALAAAAVAARAAELGEARVSSHIGQPLVADIELALIDDPAQAVSVRLASPEVYSGAGIAMPPALASVNLTVMRRDGRQFLHVTTLRPVDSEHLHLYLELADKGQRAVRLATLWLTPDPHPAPPPVLVPAPVQAPVPAPVPAAPAYKEKPPVQPQAAPATVIKPARPAAERAHPGLSHVASPSLPLHLPPHLPQPAAPAACERQAAQAAVCAALDGKNAALKAQIGVLEGKVKSLRAAMVTSPAPAPALAPAAAAHKPVQEASGPKPISAIKPLVPRKPKTAPPVPEAGLPWGWIGGGAGLLLALAAALLLLRRRGRTVRTVRNVDIPEGPRLAERLRQSMGRPAKPAPEPVAEAVEPSFD